jgi:hypothetical protein
MHMCDHNGGSDAAEMAENPRQRGLTRLVLGWQRDEHLLHRCRHLFAEFAVKPRFKDLLCTVA